MSSFMNPKPNKTGDESSIETTLRPLTLDEYVGQSELKENLRIYIKI